MEWECRKSEIIFIRSFFMCKFNGDFSACGGVDERELNCAIDSIAAQHTGHRARSFSNANDWLWRMMKPSKSARLQAFSAFVAVIDSRLIFNFVMNKTSDGFSIFTFRPGAKLSLTPPTSISFLCGQQIKIKIFSACFSLSPELNC